MSPASAEAGFPATWGTLTISELLGAGSFARVHRAWDPQLQRDVALKLFARIEWRESPGSGARPAEEGRHLARLRHPNLVAIHGADTIDGHTGLEMELIRGCTLRDLLQKDGRLGPGDVALMGRDVCRALAVIHRAGLLHDDVKPQNVMRDDGGRIVLMDFGAPRLAPESGAGVLAGAPVFKSPEVISGGTPSAQSDIFSLGIVLFLLVAGRYPAGASPVDVFQMYTTGCEGRLHDLRPDLPKRFIQVVERALTVRPENRYATAGEFELALSEASPQ